MPKVDVDAIEPIIGVGYPDQFKEQSAGRRRRRIGDAGGIADFGVNLTSLPPGKWSSQRHWHRDEDEVVFIVQGELTLVEDQGDTVLRAGDFATFPKNSGNGHHLQNRTDTIATYIEIGSRNANDLITCSDVDMECRDFVFVHKDGTPYK